MKTHLLIFLISIFLLSSVIEAQVAQTENQNAEQIPCPPFNDGAYQALKQFVTNELPKTRDGSTIVQAVSPNEITWVEFHPRCESMINKDDDPDYISFWRSNNYYFVLITRKPVTLEIDDDGMLSLDGFVFFKDMIAVYDLNLNLLGHFL
ncbi:MAG: hypothetical protein LAT57_06065 [Balneolales bacterium]|nr:hypothetical protein [Balneolales bacterium]